MRQRKQRVDELTHLPRAGRNLSQPLLRLPLELVVVLVQQELGEAVHGAQRRSKVMGDRVVEGFQLSIGGLERDLGLLAFREIARDLRETDELPFRVFHRRDDDVDPELDAVLPQTPALVFKPAVPSRRVERRLRLAALNVLGKIE